ncbi:hypothetical protein [Desulfosporosinus hippei]|uniref:DUF4868 domain-containing protein n=1 Tax=Desulfosporosinus hippei DSM 8344 TaxID=1121419 RepID=A0A1G8FLY4_9FIRM|nr:hypothetical protein [Desulfosporosinus hippei]SDH83183.1 hypothetical protein SAMN05443529_12012 [Desulfosporosinus hippei DSM 8344]
MFENKSLFAILAQDGTEQITRIELTKDTQSDICELFSDSYNALVQNKSQIAFTGTYKPDKEEILSISNFEMQENIINAIKNPIGVTAFQPNLKKLPDIKTLFVGEKSISNQKGKKFTIAFQRFRRDQYISRKGINLYHDKDTFDRDKRYGITINDIVDCVYDDNFLIFDSYYFARQIFDLSEYYRVATNTDVETFINNPKIKIEDSSTFKLHADSWVRRKIALIDDSGIFNKFTVKQINDKAKSIGMTLSVKKGKLNLPSDKKELKNVLKFLDDEIYKGIFSDELLQTNSKRKAEI